MATTSLLAAPARAEDETADGFVKHLSSEMLNSIKTDHASRVGNVPAMIALVDAKLMPSLNFKRMTSCAACPTCRQIAPEQQRRLQEEFKILLLRTYAGALSQISDVAIAVKSLRAATDDKELVVRTEVKGQGDPIQLDYRLEKTDVREVAGKFTI